MFKLKANLRWTTVGRAWCSRCPSNHRTIRRVVRRSTVVQIVNVAWSFVAEVEVQVALKKKENIKTWANFPLECEFLKIGQSLRPTFTVLGHEMAKHENFRWILSSGNRAEPPADLNGFGTWNGKVQDYRSLMLSKALLVTALVDWEQCWNNVHVVDNSRGRRYTTGYIV